MASHTPEYLVKFCTAETGKLILKSNALRWSSPHLFGDPFELTHESQLSFDPQILLQAAIKMSTAMIFAKEAPKGNTPLINAIRRWREEERFASPEEAYDVLKELLSQVVDHRLNVIEHMMTQWRKYARSLRVCNLSTKADNLCAWQYFGQQHQGVAIRFQTGENTTLPKPEKVLYKGARPEISSLRDEMSIIMGGADDNANEHFEEKFIHKAPHCANEEEWRCFRQVTESVGGANTSADSWYEDVPFQRSEVTALYLGAYTPANIKKELLDIINASYPSAPIFQTRISAGKYELEFEKLT